MADHSRQQLGAQVVTPHRRVEAYIPAEDKEWLTAEYGSIAEGLRVCVAEARRMNDCYETDGLKGLNAERGES